MSPSLVAEYHLFARGCMENASWLEVLFSYFAAEMQFRSWSSFIFVLIFIQLRVRWFKNNGCTCPSQEPSTADWNASSIIQAAVHQYVQLEVVEKHMRAFHNERLSHSNNPIASKEGMWKCSPDCAPTVWLTKSFCHVVSVLENRLSGQINAFAFVVHLLKQCRYNFNNFTSSFDTLYIHLLRLIKMVST